MPTPFDLLLTAPHDSTLGAPGYLEHTGLRLHHLPLIEIAEVEGEELARLRAAAQRIERFGAILLTSRRALPPLLRECEAASAERGATFDPQVLPPALCIGRRTADAARALRLRVAMVAESSSSEGMWEALAGTSWLDSELLFPRSREAGTQLVERLTAARAVIHDVVAYGPRTRWEDADAVRELARRGIDGVAFTSSSTALAFGAILGAGDRALFASGTTRFFCLGPATAETAAQQGFEPRVLARPHDAEGMRAAILAACAPS